MGRVRSLPPIRFRRLARSPGRFDGPDRGWIVTRLLKRFEQARWVSLGRESIELLDNIALRALAAGQEKPENAVG
jgi:hypothetical protein